MRFNFFRVSIAKIVARVAEWFHYFPKHTILVTVRLTITVSRMGKILFLWRNIQTVGNYLKIISSVQLQQLFSSSNCTAKINLGIKEVLAKFA